MLLHARSADEAMRILRADRHIAVAIVDVVMEEPQAGLAHPRFVSEPRTVEGSSWQLLA